VQWERPADYLLSHIEAAAASATIEAAAPDPSHASSSKSPAASRAAASMTRAPAWSAKVPASAAIIAAASKGRWPSTTTTDAAAKVLAWPLPSVDEELQPPAHGASTPQRGAFSAASSSSSNSEGVHSLGSTRDSDSPFLRFRSPLVATPQVEAHLEAHPVLARIQSMSEAHHPGSHHPHHHTQMLLWTPCPDDGDHPHGRVGAPQAVASAQVPHTRDQRREARAEQREARAALRALTASKANQQTFLTPAEAKHGYRQYASPHTGSPPCTQPHRADQSVVRARAAADWALGVVSL
jgi:hypothetical protein